MNQLLWNGCWEIRPGRAICRWMIVWKNLRDNICGVIGGYSGGGTFQLEKFNLQNERVLIEGKSDFCEIDQDVIDLMENCQDLLLEFHEEELWFESDNLILVNEKINMMRKDHDLLMGGNEIPENLLSLFKEVGLISYPK